MAKRSKSIQATEVGPATLYFPVEMIEEMTRESERLDRSVSWCLLSIWKHVRDDFRAVPDEEDHPRAEQLFEERYHAGDKAPATVYFNEVLYQELVAEAGRLDRSISWLMQRAWCIGHEHLAVLPRQAPLED
jgi:uncharacterized small protein (TIGR04563 family)